MLLDNNEPQVAYCDGGFKNVHLLGVNEGHWASDVTCEGWVAEPLTYARRRVAGNVVAPPSCCYCVLILTHCGRVDKGSDSPILRTLIVGEKMIQLESAELPPHADLMVCFRRIMPVCQPCSTSQYRRLIAHCHGHFVRFPHLVEASPARESVSPVWSHFGITFQLEYLFSRRLVRLKGSFGMDG
jgi:hypothetical protein